MTIQIKEKELKGAYNINPSLILKGSGAHHQATPEANSRRGAEGPHSFPDAFAYRQPPVKSGEKVKFPKDVLEKRSSVHHTGNIS